MIENQDIFIFSLSDWSKELVANRYQMATRFAKKNRVFFFERPIIPTFHDFDRWGEIFFPVEQIQKNFYLIKIPSVNIENQKNIYFFYIQKIMAAFNVQKPIFWFYNFNTAYLIDFFKPQLACYHATEDYEGVMTFNHSTYKEEGVAKEKELVRKVDLIFAVSQGLTKKLKRENPLTFPALNGVDYDPFSLSQNRPKGGFGSGPVIGLMGSVSPIIDFEILDYLAQKMPKVKLVIIGPVTAKSPYLNSLRKRANVQFVPKQQFEKMPAFIREFDVCLISYIQEDWFVKVAQPLKLFQYLASGKPIVSTPMDSLHHLSKLVYIAKNKKEYLQQVKRALKEKDRKLCRQRIELARKNTWDKRFEFINKKMAKVLSGELTKPAIINPKSLENLRRKEWLIDIKEIYDSQTIISQGKKILRHEFTILNKTRKFGPQIDWSAAFDSNKSWEKGDYQYLNQTTFVNGFDNPKYIGDVKLPWEFNKHLHFITLAACYRETAGEKYAQELLNEMTDWLKQNPLGYNQPWTQTLIVSHRAISWVIALGELRKSSLMTDEVWDQIFASCNDHSEYIERNYEIGEMSSNHLLGNLAAQIVLCAQFPEITDAATKLSRALKMLEEELDKQIYPDGASYEQSLSYHRVILEFLLLVLMADKKKMVKISVKVKNKVKKMAEFLSAAGQPNGFYQPISDADGARVFLLQNNVLDSRPYLKIAAQLLGEIMVKQSKVFTNSGYAFLRSKSAWLFFDGGPIGMGKNNPGIELGTHGHSDTLNFGLALGNQTIITDIGSYAYTTERRWHQFFRSGQGHNLPLVDGEDENILSDKPWVMRQTAQGQNFEYQLGQNIDYVAAEHQGYKRLKNPVNVRREIIFHKKENWAAVCDTFTGKGEHEIDELLHLYPGLKSQVKSGVITIDSDIKLKITPFFDGDIKTESSWYALDYGLKTKAEVIKIKTKIQVPSSLITLLNWGKFDIKKEQVEQTLKKFK